MKRVLLLFCILFTGLVCYADENVLQTIEIEPVKDTYNIVLVSDKAVDVKKTVQDTNKINLTLKDIRASKTLNTIYNNVSNVDTVMVEQQGNGVNIYFQAENAEAATVTFDSGAPAPLPVKASETTKSMKLNNPIESYAPIYKDDYQTAKTSKMFDRIKASTAVSGIKETLEDETPSDTANRFISFGIIILLAVGVVKLFKKKEPEMQIGLSQQFSAPQENTFLNSQLRGQTNLTSPKPFTTVNYGLNAYKNENRNPYETEPVQFHNPKLRNFSAQNVKNTSAGEYLRQSASSAATVTAPQTQAKKMTTPVSTAPVNRSNPNIDNLKFLESMTAIYEKSGRHDLAKGLKASLGKASAQV